MYKMFVKIPAFLSIAFAAATFALNVDNIADCPKLPARNTVIKDVNDLRIDDIKVIGGLGDSIMAGFAMMGVDYQRFGVHDLELVSEYRGNSYAMGGDVKAISIANFVKHFSPTVQGASIFAHLASYCKDGSCEFPGSFYRLLLDRLNAAQSNAVAMNLDYELDYLIPRMKSYAFSTDYENDWKMITIQIGSNDQCASCGGIIEDHVTADAYGNYVEAAIERIRAEIPKVVVSLFASSKVSRIFSLTAGQAYCVPNGHFSNVDECPCFASAENLAKMDALSDAYNAKLEAIANKYKGQPNGTFAVMYSPAPIDISSWPINALRYLHNYNTLRCLWRTHQVAQQCGLLPSISKRP
ncbi:hypothetical protein MBANPS3_010164 [Mucor bainieri]